MTIKDQEHCGIDSRFDQPTGHPERRELPCESVPYEKGSEPKRPVCDSGDCLCLVQLKNMLEQILSKYPGYSVNLYLESGVTVTGVLHEMLPDKECAGLVHIGANQYVSMRSIAAIRIPGAYYDGCFRYLPVPDEEPIGCFTDWEKAIRMALNEDQLVQVRAGGQIVSNELVMESEFGMIVTACYNGLHPTFISICHIDSFTIR